MLNTQLISSARPQHYLPELFGFLSQVHIYLYRGTVPNTDLTPMDCWLDPKDRPSRNFESSSHITPEHLSFVFHVHRISLKGNQPLWFLLVAYANGFIPNIFTSFVQMGGGGRGPSDDAQTLQDLYDYLRTFPEDWYCMTQFEKQPTRQGFIRGNLLHDEPALPDEVTL